MTKRGRGRPPKLRVDSDEENICAVCCEIFILRKGKATCLFDLQKFSASITSGDNHGDIEGVEKVMGRPKKSSFVSKNGDNNKPLLCEKCFSSVSLVLEKRRVLEGMEVEVRKLQKKILEMLRDLQEGIEDFKEGMEKVEETMEVSLEKVNKLEQFFAKEEEDDAVEQREVTGSMGIKDVIQFREKIFAVVEDLLEFNRTLQTASVVPPHLHTEENPIEDGTRNLSSSLQRSISSPLTRPERLETEDGDFDEEWTPAEDIAFSDTDDKLSMEVTPEDRPKGGRRPERNAVKTWKAEQEDEEWVPVGEGSNSKTPSIDVTPRGHPKNERGRKRKAVTTTRTDGSGEEDEAENDDEYIPASVNIKRKRKKRKDQSEKLSSKLGHIDFTVMTNFKKRLITLVIEKLENAQPTTIQKNSDSASSTFDAIDPQRTHFVTYDPTTDTLNHAGFQLTIHAVEESVQCSECGKSLYHLLAKSQPNKKPHALLQKISDHILGFHLKLFSCPHCPATLTTHKNFKNHFLGHLNHFTCDVCGKPLKGSEALRRHKWLHMSDIEKAEAVASQGIQDGLTPSERRALKMRTMDNKFQCSTCGKGFPLQSSLQKHEQVHLNVRRRICANCGKDFKHQGSFLYHQKFTCFPEGSEDKKKEIFRFQCDQCPRRFAYHRKLQVHKQTIHEDFPCNFKCSMCDKAFKIKKYLIQHELTHFDNRQYLCGKGCGATFKTRSPMVRHQKKCGWNSNF